MRFLFLALLIFLSAAASGANYPMPAEEFDIVGIERVVKARYEDSLLDIARRYDVGQAAILLANPGVDRWLPGSGTSVVVPSRHILPSVPLTGLVLNLPEMRLYYFPEAEAGSEQRVLTYPVSIGRMDWATPLGETRLLSKQKDPPWIPPESIRREHAENGEPLPEYVPPGPDNPLGRHALRLGIPGYLIHGTNKEFGVGLRASHGCIRMLPEDIEELFELLPIGTAVRIINQPVKAGWYGGDLYLEVHPPLEEDNISPGELYKMAQGALDEVLFRRQIDLDLEAVSRAVSRPTGLPVVISR